jgi:hypothetical protein
MAYHAGMRGDSYQVQGQQGGLAITSANGAVTRNFRTLMVVNDAVLSALTSNIEGGSTKLITITLPAGLVIGGQITAVTVSSGVVIGYDQ